MADELLDLELNDENQDELISRSEKRIKGLSEKVKTISQERDDFAKAKEALEAEKAQLAKETEFHKNFNTLIGKYQGSADFQDKIKEKYMSGYDIEDATISIMAKEGKYNPSPITERRESPAGGSATNTIKSDDKTMGEMSRDEKRAKLMENEAEMIDLLSPKIRM